MNGYERIQATLAGKPTDRTPMMLHNFMSATREAGLTMSQFRRDPKKMADVFIRAARRYGLDGILTDVDTALLAGAMGAKVDFPEDIPARVVAPSGKTPEEILAKIDPQNLVHDERIQLYLEMIRILRQQVGGEFWIRGNADQGPFSLAVVLRGMMPFLTEFRRPECVEWITSLLDRCYDVHLKFHQMVLAAGADMTSFGDSMCGPDLISPADYRRFALPYQQRLQRELSKNVPPHQVVCHICGNTTRIIPDLAEVGFTGVELDYKTHIESLTMLRGKTVLFGTIDPSGVFCLGTPELVVEKTNELIDQFPNGGLVIGAGCALPAETPSANIFTFVETVKKSEIAHRLAG